jgi:hypothetical protein
MILSQTSFVRFWLIPASFVVVFRFFNGADIGYDLTVQLQAAQNLVAGHGLSIYSLGGEPNLAAPNRLVPLTYFPAGYSLFAVLPTALGCTAAITVKLLAAAGTLLGWWGWSRLAYLFMRDGVERAARWRYVAVVIAIATPLLFTPPWTSTDIFLWVAIPWVLQFVVRAADPNEQHRAWFDLIAGALAGFAVLMRYQSLLLAGYAALLIVCQSGMQLKVLARRAITFATGFVPLVSAQIYNNYFRSFASAVPVTPGGLNLGHSTSTLGPALGDGFLNLTSANFPLIWWLPERVVKFLTQSGEQAPCLLVFTLAGFALMPIVFAAKLGHHSITAAARDLRTAAIGLFIAFPLFLWACALGGTFYVGVWRYYLPLLPLAVLMAYAFAIPAATADRAIARWTRFGTIGYLAAYVGLAIAGVALLVIPGSPGDGRRARLLGTVGFDYRFSLRPGYEFSPARNYILDLLKQQPDTILVTNRPEWFYADPKIDRSRLHRLERMKARYVTGPAHILILATDPFPVADTALYWFTSFGTPRPVSYFASVPDLHLLRRFPEEHMKVLEAEIPAGAQFEIKHPPPVH